MSRVRVGLGGIRGRDRSSNRSEDDGETQTGALNDVQRISRWKPKVGVKNRSANMVPTEDGGSTVELPSEVVELRPGDC